MFDSQLEYFVMTLITYSGLRPFWHAAQLFNSLLTTLRNIEFQGGYGRARKTPAVRHTPSHYPHLQKRAIARTHQLRLTRPRLPYCGTSPSHDNNCARPLTLNIIIPQHTANLPVVPPLDRKTALSSETSNGKNSVIFQELEVRIR